MLNFNILFEYLKYFWYIYFNNIFYSFFVKVMVGVIDGCLLKKVIMNY